ncbi:TATA-binding protein associated factor taf2 [Moesziomyces antarcticus]|uniref:Related to TAF2 - component of TFIID complex n=2 Tax=Pseudozyma antarctica TaxID=84753 RepID=A0A5C3FNG0_PSEA2|nr:TATA-binding protein associated factor taf2 [Moesziomyces antarcticus]GAK64470.1 TATA-binding protein associated factor taf2 [Moesziomyces antarcticus]SPO45021.1 related to TAF2 - component of TFIID complex [Moesziomyces antarcticus]
MSKLQRGTAAYRGFTVSHQRVVLDLGFNGTVVGFTELTIVPAHRSLRTIHLNCRQAFVQSVSIAGHAAEFSYADHLTGASIADTRDVHRYPELKRRIYAAASDGAHGELSILIPPDVHIQSQRAGSRAQSITPDDAPTPGGSSASNELAPITVRVDYYLKDPTDGIQFMRPTADSPYRVPHLFTIASSSDAARSWVPCVDSLWERCTWEFEFIVPKSLSTSEEDDDANPDQTANRSAKDSADTATAELADPDSEVVVVCTGDLMEQVTHPNNPAKTVFCYTQAVPTSIQHVAFAAGPFHIMRVQAANRQAGQTAASIVTEVTAGAPLDDSGQPEILAFCLPGRQEELRNSIGFTRQALDFFSQEYGSYPFTAFRMVFVDEPPQDCTVQSMMAVCSNDLLHPASVIDQAIENRQVLSHAIAFQWVGINIIQATWADTWLVNGLSLYINGLFLRRLMGNNEYRFRLKKDLDRLCAWDIGMPPLYEAGAFEPPDAATLPFVNLKAPLVLHILDRRLRKMGASVGLGRVIPKVFLQAMTGEMTNNMLSTQQFLRTCRKVSGADLRLFTEHWIRGSGCPRFICSANFNRKKLLIEMHIRQEVPAAQFAAARPGDALAANAVPLFEGQMTVRIHEADGTPYEHVLEIKGPAKRYEVPFNTKYKRVRRNTKRFQARQAAAAAAAQGDQEAQEAIGLIDLGFGLGMWEDEQAREEWKVADWTEEDEEKMSSAPYEWIRMDADFEWLASIHFEQPDHMWVSQLQRDRDVVAQVSAVHALAQMPSLVTCSMLTRTVLVNKYFYRVRTEAVHALVHCAIPQLDNLGLFHLLKLFRSQFCHDPPNEASFEDPLDVPCIPRANDFSDAADYFLQRALIHAISRVRNPDGRTPAQVKRFLINLLRYNDNSTNHFVDDFYLAGAINALASAFIPIDSGLAQDSSANAEEENFLLAHAIAEVERLQELDRLVPSFHNVITLASLDFQVVMMLANLKPRDLQLFFTYTRQGNFTPVRVAALNCLLLVGNLDHRVIARYCFALLRIDENRTVKRALARALCEGLAVAMSTGLFGGGALRGPETLLIEEDSGHINAAEKARDAQLEAMLKTLKKEIGRSAGVREGFLAALLAPNADVEARWAMLKLAELLFRPAEEKELPLQHKVQLRVRMPSTQATLDNAPMESPSISKIKLVRPGISSAEEDAAAKVPASLAAAASNGPRVAFETPEKVTAERKKVKPKKIKPLAPGQASGMSFADLTACRNTLKKLMQNKHASIFLNPVDPVRDQATDYFDVIKEPMDLGSILNKLDSGQYKDRHALRADFELMIRNAKTYTPDPKAWAHKQAVGLEKVFGPLWNRMEKTLEQSAARQKAAQDAALANEHSASVSGTPERPSPAKPEALPAASDPIAPTLPSSGARRESSTPSAAPKLSLKFKLKSKPAGEESPAAATPTPKPKAKPVIEEPSPAAPSTQSTTLKIKKPLIKLKKPSEGDAGVPSTPSPAPPVATNAGPQSVDDDILELLGEIPKPSKPKPSKSSSGVSPSPAPVAAASAHASPPAPSPSVKKHKSAHTDSFGGTATPARPNGSSAASAESPTKDIAKLAEKDPVGATAGMPMSGKKCKVLLQVLKKSPFSIFFRFPVDPINDGLPTYLDEIKEPMDLSTMEKKVNQAAYSTMGEFAADMELIFANCRQFNPPGTEPCQHADELEKLWRKEWAKTVTPRLEANEKRALVGLMNRLKTHQSSLLFREPVDPVALGIPTYFDVIPRKDARDLSLIEAKLKGDKYDAFAALDADIKLMLKNCYTFNAMDPAIIEIAKAFETFYKREFNHAKQQAGTASAGSPAPPAAKRKLSTPSNGTSKKVKSS